MSLEPARRLRSLLMTIPVLLGAAVVTAAEAPAADATAAPDALPVDVNVTVTLDASAIEPQMQALDARLVDLGTQVTDLRDRVTLLAAAPGTPDPRGDGHEPPAVNRPRPLVGVSVVPPGATSTNWVFGDLLRQAEFIDGAWRAFTGATDHGAKYPHDGYLIEPRTAARLTDTGNGLIIHAPADARDRGVHVWMPGAVYEDLFHPLYLERLQPFGVLRFGQWMASREAEAPDLRRLAVSILLSNANGSSPWYVMGHGWSDEDVRRCAAMAARGLDPAVPVYVEWGAQPWVGIPTEIRHTAAERWAHNAARDFEIWREAFGETAHRVIRVLAGPTDDVETAAAMAATLGPDGFDALACDASFSPADTPDQLARLRARGPLDDEALMRLLERAVDDHEGAYARYAELAKRYGVPLLAYRAGQRIDPAEDGAGMAVQFHPRMYGLYLRHAQQWFAAQREAGLPAELIARGVMVYGHDVWPAGEGVGSGLLAYQDQPLAWAPKYRAAEDLARRPRLVLRSASARRPEGWTPPQGEGWSPIQPALDTRVIYVSTSAGNDANDGLSPATAVATPARGYELLRDGFPDWLLFKRGDSFRMTGDDPGWHNWCKSGRSPDQRMVIATYGSPDAPPPKVYTAGHSFVRMWGGGSHLIFRGFDLVSGRAPTDPAPPEEAAIRLRSATAHDVTFEGLTIGSATGGYFTGVEINGSYNDADVSDIILRRCVVQNAWAPTSGPGEGHAQGMYFTGFTGLTVEGCVFDHNGWLPGRADLRTVFRHQLYLSEMHDAAIRGNVFANESFAAIKVRSDHKDASRDVTLEGNVFFNSFLPIAVGGEPKGDDAAAVLHRNLTIRDNVFTVIGGPLPRRGQRFGTAIDIRAAGEVLIQGNIMTHAAPDASDSPAIVLFPGQRPHGDMTVRGNVIHDWNPAGDHDDLIRVGGGRPASGLTIQDNRIALPDDAYVDAARTLEQYRDCSLDDLIGRLKGQNVYHWRPELTAGAIVDWFKQGYAPRE